MSTQLYYICDRCNKKLPSVGCPENWQSMSVKEERSGSVYFVDIHYCEKCTQKDFKGTRRLLRPTNIGGQHLRLAERNEENE